MAKSMTPAARQRLRELAEQTRGRRSLRGYDGGGWAATLDELLADGGDAVRALAAVRAPRSNDSYPAGATGQPAPGFPTRTFHPAGGFLCDWRDARARALSTAAKRVEPTDPRLAQLPEGWRLRCQQFRLPFKYWKAKDEPAVMHVSRGDACRWVALKTLTPTQQADLCRALPTRYVQSSHYAGPAVGHRVARTPLWEADRVLQLLLLLWPPEHTPFTALQAPAGGGTPVPVKAVRVTAERFGEAVRKYCYGYTDLAAARLEVPAAWEPPVGLSTGGRFRPGDTGPLFPPEPPDLSFEAR